MDKSTWHPLVKYAQNNYYLQTTRVTSGTLRPGSNPVAVWPTGDLVVA